MREDFQFRIGERVRRIKRMGGETQQKITRILRDWSSGDRDTAAAG
jgi:hypothetical protein